MIKTFKDKQTENVFKREGSRKYKAIEKVALRKLLILEGAGKIDDIAIPPANRLEKLKGNRAGQYSIRINDQWRICFRWIEGNAYDVEIVDYH